ncbi:MAG TPA: alpha/beta fold hydrolase [Jiangellaceae bacterium]|nr:alpha/beta fold hydrolase [Jiangellaceae bacterium]
MDTTQRNTPSASPRTVALRAGRVMLIAISTGALAVTGLILWWSSGEARPFLGRDGKPLPGSISDKIRVEINGVEQGMFIRGMDVHNPVLLLVHGGPGMPDYFLREDHPTRLEEHFTVAWWDQRGAGLSYDHRIPRSMMTVAQFVADTLAVTDYLRERFGQDKIYLLGHSWGSFIGIQAAQRAPERFHAYIGMAQMAHQLKSETLAYDYMLREYKHRGDEKMVQALEEAPVTMEGGAPQGYRRLRDKAMHRVGIGTMHNMDSVITGLFLPSLRFPEYTVAEKIALWRGKAFSKSTDLFDIALQTDLADVVPELQVPVYFLEGAYDYTCNYDLAREYFRSLKAPVKGFYTFEESAHSPVFEEPDKASQILAQDVLAATNTLADSH